MNYEDKLKDPRWQELRLSIIERDQRCQCCGDTHYEAEYIEGDYSEDLMVGKKLTLQVHHKKYFKNLEPWEYDPKYLVTLCKECHERIHVKMKDEEEIINSPAYKTIKKAYDRFYKDVTGKNPKTEEEGFEHIWYSYNKNHNGSRLDKTDCFVFPVGCLLKYMDDEVVS